MAHQQAAWLDAERNTNKRLREEVRTTQIKTKGLFKVPCMVFLIIKATTTTIATLRNHAPIYVTRSLIP